MRCKLGDISEITKLAGYEFTKYIKYIPDGEIIAVRALNLKNGALVLDDIQRISKEVSETLPRSQLNKNDIVLSYTGTLGECAQIREDGKYHLAPNVCKITPNDSVVNPNFLFQYIRCEKFKQTLINYAHGSTQPTIPMSTIRDIPVDIPDDLEKQGKIAAILSALDEKIAINRAINDNLEQQAMALYRQMFVETNNDARRECRADEYFDISIGKTPPRKEAQWFSMNPTDCIWVSISDMGRCGMYIADSSEYLTHESVDKFNIKVVPDNTVLLSFKLTVGRVAITDGAMVTNEAIAHFKTDKLEINEYLYCYLKDFNYQTMGSTSSIATAVNSKIIKAMPFVVPTDAELVSFHSATAPMFEMIKTRQRENTRLAELRDSLLPKLMSGEIDVSDVQI